MSGIGPISGPHWLPYSRVVINTSGLLSYWRFGEALGTVAIDQLASAAGTYVASPTLSFTGALRGGDTDTAVSVNGSTQWITANRSTQTAGSIELWFKRTRTLTVETLLDTAATGVDLVFDNAGNNTLTLNKQATGYLISASIDIADTLWHHVVATWDGTTAGRHIYLDGVNRDGAAGPQTSPVAQTSVTIGANYALGTPFAGGIDELAIYNRVLGSAEVLAHYRAATT